MATSRQIGVAAPPIAGIAVTTRRVKLLQNYFYFSMSLLIAAVVVYGFSRTVNENLIHPAAPRPFILYLHAAIFMDGCCSYVQSALVRTGNVRMHRKWGGSGRGWG